jgi:hypothetical protein
MLDADRLPAYSTVARNVAALLEYSEAAGPEPVGAILPRLRLVAP